MSTRYSACRHLKWLQQEQQQLKKVSHKQTGLLTADCSQKDYSQQKDYPQQGDYKKQIWRQYWKRITETTSMAEKLHQVKIQIHYQPTDGGKKHGYKLAIQE